MWQSQSKHVFKYHHHALKIKDRQHIVLRWRQLENRRLRRYVDSIGRLEFPTSHDYMRCLVGMHNMNFVPEYDQQVGAFWQTIIEGSTKRSAEGSREGARELSDDHLWRIIGQASDHIKRGTVREFFVETVIKIEASISMHTWIWSRVPGQLIAGCSFVLFITSPRAITRLSPPSPRIWWLLDGGDP